MYDDLARAQQQSALEWFVLNAVIPSVLLSLALQGRSPASSARPSVTYTDMCVLPNGPIIEERISGWPLPDVFPTLIRMPRPVYPALMRRYGVAGRVVLRALVNSRGQVDSTSILVVQATDGAFVPAAFRALAHAAYRPARFGGQPGAAWVTLAVDFSLRQE